MRIGIDARLWNETGVGRYIRNLVAQLHEIDKKNSYVLFVTPKAVGMRSFDFAQDDMRWKVVETDIRWHTVEEQMLFHTVLNNEGLDLVHFPYFSIPISYNKPFVITIHDLILNHFPTGKASTLPFPLYQIKHFGYKFIMREAAKKSQKIIAVSEATKKEIVDHLPVSSDKIVVTYEGVDDKLNSKVKSQNLKFQVKSQKYFLYVGNAYPHKNLERLIEGFGDLISRGNKDVKLILVGEKNYFYNRLEELVKKKRLEKSVLFYGRANDDELISLYRYAQAVVVASLMEGFGLPGLEAMQSECLVLASDIPVLKEIYIDAAVYFDPLDPKAMSDVMQEVLENPAKFKEFKKKGIERTKAFSWKKMAEQTLKVYEDSISIRSDK